MEVRKSLLALRDPALQSIYAAAADNRRLGAFGSLTSDEARINALWAEELALAKAHPTLFAPVRDAACHEAVMWYVHHLSKSAKAEAHDLLTLPRLPLQIHVFNHELIDAGSAHAKVAGHYQQGLGCVDCHSSHPDKPGNKMHHNWPKELEYTATGFGPFPFWDAGGPGCSSCNVSIGDGIHGAPLRVQYSAAKNSETLMHSKCSLKAFGGPGTWEDRVPCNHLFTPSGEAFIYIPHEPLKTDPNPSWCCKSYAAKSTAFGTGVPPNDWFKMMTYKGIAKEYTGAFYKGPIKQYVLNAPFSFWYYTTGHNPSFGSAELPIEQGEGCRVPQSHPPKEPCTDGLPVTLYHDYDTSHFVNRTWTAADFTVPAICLGKEVKACAAPGSGGPDSKYHGILTMGARLSGVKNVEN